MRIYPLSSSSNDDTIHSHDQNIRKTLSLLHNRIQRPLHYFLRTNLMMIRSSSSSTRIRGKDNDTKDNVAVYSHNTNHTTSIFDVDDQCRRMMGHHGSMWIVSLLTTSLMTTSFAATVTAAEAIPSTTSIALSNALQDIKTSVDTLQTLLTNWERAVIDCTYADVPRDLLETKNKELLLEKASTFALFDKSVSVISCKTTTRIVRDYLGRTGIGPVATLDKTLKRILNILVKNSDDTTMKWDVDMIVQRIEQIQQDMNQADALSYSARRHSSALNNFNPKDTTTILANHQELIETKQTIQSIVNQLNDFIRYIESS
jgi:hypothetical protein